MRHRLAFSFLILLLAVGCGDGVDRPPMYPVSGKVTYNDKPVVGATVHFYHEGLGRAPVATTDAEGNFEISTFEPGDGAEPGEYSVLVSKWEAPKISEGTAPPKELPDPLDPNNAEELIETIEEPVDDSPPPPSKSLLPEKYGSPDQTPLKATVTADGPNEFTFKLTD